MFHVELRRFPHVARAFNLNRDQLKARILLPWVRGTAIDLEERRWTSERTRLTIYDAPELATEDRGLGRGWATVTRDGEDVTTKLLEAARAQLRDAGPEGSLPELKRELLAAAAGEGVPVLRAVMLIGRRRPAWRASERLALAERAVWELLHEGRLTMLRSGSVAPVAAEEWEALLLDWETWTDRGAAVRVRATSS